MQAWHVAIDAECRRRARRRRQSEIVGLIRALAKNIRVIGDGFNQLLANLAERHAYIVLHGNPEAVEFVLGQLNSVVGRHLAAVLLRKPAAIPLRFQLVDVNRDGADAEQLDAIHCEILLGLVHQADNHVVVVAHLLAQPDEKNADLGLAGAVKGQRHQRIGHPLVGRDLVVVALAVAVLLDRRRLELVGDVQVEAAETADNTAAECVLARRQADHILHRRSCDTCMIDI